MTDHLQSVKSRNEQTINATKKWSFKRDGLLLEVYLILSNRMTATRRWSPIAGRSLVGGLSLQVLLYSYICWSKVQVQE